MSESAKKVVTPEMIKQAGEMLRSEHQERVRLEKVAADLELEKRAQKLAYREVEMGISEPFKTFDEFQEKVAGLLKEDLDVVQKALDRGYSGVRKNGDLDSGSNGKGLNPLESWVLNGELTE